ncbi:hypothetical protein HN419_03960 [Candidatus Woesearchaeota archaeon]|jgi:hypothetical protein|nr:hypothetical protein [Candidatus Woesearchaeota archaeon]MBT7929184.1 hypothetical protein [Candidatus Peregrinibacteria bacterium]MBT3537967.1 hypothetical protein [Candidatus Woesearchaeota archaeon]MBT4697322.1 hypothetical protein [Candidatus Woesearchaeota archaeon]MBT4717042.1 hypothetical protein [Candidatus Woesearchaeota archaeon]
MTTGLDKVLESYDLRPGDNVDISLSANTLTPSEELNKRGSTWTFRLELRVNDKDRGRPIDLADVLRAPDESLDYGKSSVPLLDVVAAMKYLGIVGAPTHILEPFMDIPPIGLEDKMSSDSILYVFSGLVEYARAIAERIKPAEGDAALFRGKVQLTPRILDRLYSQVEDIYKGPKDFAMDDLRNLEAASGMRRSS